VISDANDGVNKTIKETEGGLGTSFVCGKEGEKKDVTPIQIYNKTTGSWQTDNRGRSLKPIARYKTYNQTLY
jgi:hypothetical protein